MSCLFLKGENKFMKRHKLVKVGISKKIGDNQRGVFANYVIKEGQIIEEAPALVIPKEQADTVHSTTLQDYVFEWGDDGKELALALGYGSLYNHSYEPNAYYEQDFDNNVFEIVAHRDIPKGEEITINYNGTPEDHSPLWFTTQELD